METDGGRRGLTWAALKWIALGSMTLDHTLKMWLNQSTLMAWGMSVGDSYLLLTWLLPLGRLAFPIFAYGVGQGMAATRSRKKYLARLAAFAVLSEVPFQLVHGPLRWGATNVLFTLLLGALACGLIDLCRGRGAPWAAWAGPLSLALLAWLLGTDYGGWGVLFVAAPYAMPSRRAKLAALAALVAALYGVAAPYRGGGVFAWALGEWAWATYLLAALGAVGLLACYSGEKGGHCPKYFFYVYYPAHLLALYGLSRLTAG